MSHELAAVDASDHLRGPEDAPLTIVEYGDYDCPHTRRANENVRALEQRSNLRFRFVFRHFPLRHLHENAQSLSEIAEVAATLGHFWEVHDRLLAHRSKVSAADVIEDLKRIPLDVRELEEVLGSAAISERIERDVQSGKAAGVHSTPTWFFNGTLWEGHYDFDTLLAQALAAVRDRTG